MDFRQLPELSHVLQSIKPVPKLPKESTDMEDDSLIMKSKSDLSRDCPDTPNLYNLISKKSSMSETISNVLTANEQ